MKFYFNTQSGLAPAAETHALKLGFHRAKIIQDQLHTPATGWRWAEFHRALADVIDANNGTKLIAVGVENAAENKTANIVKALKIIKASGWLAVDYLDYWQQGGPPPSIAAVDSASSLLGYQWWPHEQDFNSLWWKDPDEGYLRRCQIICTGRASILWLMRIQQGAAHERNNFTVNLPVPDPVTTEIVRQFRLAGGDALMLHDEDTFRLWVDGGGLYRRADGSLVLPGIENAEQLAAAQIAWFDAAKAGGTA